MYFFLFSCSSKKVVVHKATPLKYFSHMRLTASIVIFIFTLVLAGVQSTAVSSHFSNSELPVNPSSSSSSSSSNSNSLILRKRSTLPLDIKGSPVFQSFMKASTDDERFQYGLELFGLTKTATISTDLNQAFRKMALMIHPDKFNDLHYKMTTENFQAINHVRDFLLKKLSNSWPL